MFTHITGSKDLSQIKVYPPSPHSYEIHSYYPVAEIQQYYEHLKTLKRVFNNTDVPTNFGVIKRVKKVMSIRSQNLYRHTECVTCGCTMDHFRLEQNQLGLHFNGYTSEGIQLTCDHIIPVSKGGPDTLENVQLMCVICNSNKSNMSQEAFEKKINIQNFESKLIIQNPKRAVYINNVLKTQRIFKSNFKIVSNEDSSLIEIIKVGITTNFEAKTFIRYFQKQLHKNRIHAKVIVKGLDDSSVVYKSN